MIYDEGNITLTTRKEIKSFFKAIRKSERWQIIDKGLIKFKIKKKPTEVKWKNMTIDDIRKYFK